MQRLEFPANSSLPFPELIGKLADYLLPFAGMWRSYWLQVAAVRDGEIWYLCHLALLGQWSQFPDPEPFCDYIQGSALITVSQRLDEVQFRQILASLRESGTVSLPHDITAQVAKQPTFNQPYWQEPVRWMPDPIVSVRETASWRYVHATGSIRWLVTDSSQEDLQTELRIRNALRADLERRSERDFETFINEKFAPRQTSSDIQYLNSFRYILDFPLALVVEPGPGDQASNTRPFIVKCRPPLSLEELRLTTGRTWTSDASPLRIEPLPSTEDGWSIGKVTVPYLCHLIWLTFSETLAKGLYYDLTVPTPEAQAKEVIGYIYNYGSPERGMEGWSHDLLESDGGKFELALLNALTRLGVPVLFAGQIEGAGRTNNQPTPGFDLVALDHTHQRAVAISAKGAPDRSPSDEDVQKVLEGVGILLQKLPGWRVHGIIACHAHGERLGRYKVHPDVRVWSLEEVAWLLSADKLDHITWLLWTPPDPSVQRAAYWG